jgi:glycosyltransferase involved in cell wall biosynthesis
MSSKLATPAKTVLVELTADFAKYSLVPRLKSEREYGRHLADLIHRSRPDVVLTANGPLLSQSMMARVSRDIGAPFIFWIQDLYGPAAEHALQGRYPRLVAHWASLPFKQIERRLLRKSDQVITIGENLTQAARDAGVQKDRLHQIGNWTDPNKVRPTLRNNEWARRQGLMGVITFGYAGTLGMKHPYAVLRDLAEPRDSKCRVFVISEGLGADWLRDQQSESLTVLDFQPEDEMNVVLGSMDVAVLLLGDEASLYSVPSKFYTYVCAGKAILGLVPRHSEVAHLVEGAGCGLVVEPEDAPGISRAVQRFVTDAPFRQVCGENARRWAERHLSAREKVDAVESVIRLTRDYEEDARP